MCVLQVNPNSIAAKDGRIREGDRIIQVSTGRLQAWPKALLHLSAQLPLFSQSLALSH